MSISRIRTTKWVFSKQIVDVDDKDACTVGKSTVVTNGGRFCSNKATSRGSFNKDDF